VFTSFSCERAFKLKCEVVCCSIYGFVVDFVGVTGSDEGEGLVYDEWDDDYDYVIGNYYLICAEYALFSFGLL
jgi:hypothetical protein